ncbi:hypothetical protein [Diplocloster agilis]|uniref:Uncharacterized protein n=1 Tax=Diplocloster agilis TaxID=2850323 RepID=A0A949NCN1_9FIRM|nr:hypothetical protein [Diplocloster agilis]MBU9735061.1 hypothetical protein [Diplocloster agilis]
MKRKQKIVLVTLIAFIVIIVGISYNYYINNHVFTDYEEINIYTPVCIDHELKNFKQLENILYDARISMPGAAYTDIITKNYIIIVATKFHKIAYDDLGTHVYNNIGTVENPEKGKWNVKAEDELLEYLEEFNNKYGHIEVNED